MRISFNYVFIDLFTVKAHFFKKNVTAAGKFSLIKKLCTKKDYQVFFVTKTGKMLCSK